MKTFAALIALAICSGCGSVTTTHNHHDVNVEGDETPIETVMIENTGWTLFNVIPIGSGNPNLPNECSCRLFEDTTTLQNNLDMLEREMKRVGATRIVNLYSKTLDESIFFLLFTRTACHTSAVLLK
jgi:uncharacterized protein YceK